MDTLNLILFALSILLWVAAIYIYGKAQYHRGYFNGCNDTFEFVIEKLEQFEKEANQKVKKGKAKKDAKS